MSSMPYMEGTSIPAWCFMGQEGGLVEGGQREEESAGVWRRQMALGGF